MDPNADTYTLNEWEEGRMRGRGEEERTKDGLGRREGQKSIV